VKYALYVLVLTALAGVSPFAVPASARERPNIVIFFTDDAGYRDIGPFGGLAPTPNLDRMAAGGMKLNSFYVASVAYLPAV
jgi:arylsulfatase A-like enzyme